MPGRASLFEKKENSMKNFVQEGKTISFTAAGDLLSGAVVIFGAILGIVCGDVLTGAVGEAAISGVFKVTKAGSQAWTAGQRIYYDISDGVFTTTQSTDTPFAGIATEAVGSGSDETTGQAVNVAALAQDISASPTEAEVQAISTKVDAILTSLKNAKIMASS
jgi:predicted RecA/RadA family phage recombinase